MVMTLSNVLPAMEDEVRVDASEDDAEGKTDRLELVQPGSDRGVRYSFMSTWLGRTLVAETESGICAILVGDDEGVLEADLAARFRGFQLLPQTQPSPLAARVAGRLDGSSKDMGDVPLSAHGTDFQRLVWNGLLEIPTGETITYATLAERVGKPGSVRAVARACGANPIAVLVPCHRVVRGDGSISGYRWGVERKVALLQKERSNKGTLWRA